MKTIYIDASSLKHSNCGRRFVYTTVDGLTLKGDKSFKAEYGTAIHKALRYFYNGSSVEEATEKAVKHYTNFDPGPTDFRTMPHLIATLKKYFKTYEHDCLEVLSDVENTKRLEVTFDIPLINEHEIEIRIRGTIDMEAMYCSQHCLVDHKSTGAQANESFFAKYTLDIQPRVYVWAYEQLHKTRPGFLVNGIFLKRVTKSMDDTCTLMRSSVFRYSDESIQDIDAFIRQKALLLWSYVKDNLNGCQDYTHCYDLFLSCPYTRICEMLRDVAPQIISTHYNTRIYDPLKFQEDTD